MTIIESDVERFAGRVRPYFEPELREIAFELAMGIAEHIGVKTKLLRPDTTLEQIFEWFRAAEGLGSLDQIEFVMSLESEFGFEIPDEIAGRPELSTFRDLVLLRARSRRAA
jgi:acyl carrier protein